MLNKPRDEENWNAFIKFCKAQDSFRGVHLEDYHPMLAKEIYDVVT